MKTITEEEFDLQRELERIHQEIAAEEKEQLEHNDAILKNLSSSAKKNFIALTSQCSVNGKIEIVDQPNGDLQIEEHYGVFKKVYVDQWSIGDSGDSFAGYIYTNHGKTNKWLKIPYTC